MQYSEIIFDSLITEARLPKNFVFSDWGYWIEPDGQFAAVERHQHHTVHRIGDHTYADGRIRVTAVTDPSTVKMDNPVKLLTANFYTNYVTKAALRALMALITEYEFDEFHIIGMTIQEHQLGDYDRGDPEQYVDRRSIERATAPMAAMACIRKFLTSARAVAPEPRDPRLTAPHVTDFTRRRKRLR